MTKKGLSNLMRLIRYCVLAEGYARAIPVAQIARLTGYSPESVPVLARRLSLPPHPNHGGKIRKHRANYVCKAPRRRNRSAEKSYYVPTEPTPITLAGPKWSWPS